MKCSRIRSLIDEAPQAEMLAPSVISHMSDCPECRTFADERARLSELMRSVGRVTAPPNFDVVLKARLVDRQATRSNRSQGWAWAFVATIAGNGSFSLRLAGGIAATVLIAAGTFYVAVEKESNPVMLPSAPPSVTARVAPEPPTNDRVASGVIEPGIAAPVAEPHVYGGSRTKRTPPVSARMAIDSVSPQPVMWMKTDEMEVGFPAVSVGAQSLYYSTAGQPSVRTVKTSF